MTSLFGNRVAAHKPLLLACAHLVVVSLLPTVARASHFSPFTVEHCEAVFDVYINDSNEVAGNCESEFTNYSYAGTLGSKIKRFRVGKTGNTFVAGLNGNGQVTGDSPDRHDPNLNQGFLRSADGEITRLRNKGNGTLIPSGINDSGIVVGYYYGTDGSQHGFVRDSAGVTTVFDAPGRANSTNALAVNNQGTVVGHFIDSSGHAEGFIRNADGAFTTFQVPKFRDTAALAINNDGAVTGTSFDERGDQFGFIRSPDGTIVKFGIGKGEQAVTPRAINDSGVIVGSFDNPKKDVTHSFVRFANGVVRTIDVPKASLTMVTSINSKGVVAGHYFVASGNSFGFTGRP